MNTKAFDNTSCIFTHCTLFILILCCALLRTFDSCQCMLADILAGSWRVSASRGTATCMQWRVNAIFLFCYSNALQTRHSQPAQSVRRRSPCLCKLYLQKYGLASPCGMYFVFWRKYFVMSIFVSLLLLACIWYTYFLG